MYQSRHDLKLMLLTVQRYFNFMCLSKRLMCVEKVSYINGEPVELVSEMLAKRARSGASSYHINIKDNAVLNSICEKVAKGDLDDFEDEDVPGKAGNHHSLLWNIPAEYLEYTCV